MADPHGELGRRRFLGVLGLAAGGAVGGGLMATGTAAAAEPGEVAECGVGQQVYIGCYTSVAAGGKGIGLATADPKTGTLTVQSTATGVKDPSFLALAPGGRTLYAVNELEQGQVSAFAIESGKLRALGQRSTKGAHPCHLVVHPSGRYLLSANYSSGSVAVHPIDSKGKLGEATHVVKHQGSGPDPDRQREPHAHMVAVDPSSRHVLAVDLGTDSVYGYKLNLETGKLAANGRLKLRPGAGPRHLAFHPGGKVVYVANELDSTVTVADYDPVSGAFTAGQTLSTLPAGTTVKSYPAEVLSSADGRFVYVSNRGHNSIAVFSTEQAGRQLKLVATPSCGGDWPRHISFGAQGRVLYAANERSSRVSVFAVDQQTGALQPAGTPLSTPTPVCVLPS